jgi:hypothetical protein
MVSRPPVQVIRMRRRLAATRPQKNGSWLRYSRSPLPPPDATMVFYFEQTPFNRIGIRQGPSSIGKWSALSYARL